VDVVRPGLTTPGNSAPRRKFRVPTTFKMIKRQNVRPRAALPLLLNGSYGPPLARQTSEIRLRLMTL